MCAYSLVSSNSTFGDSFHRYAHTGKMTYMHYCQLQHSLFVIAKEQQEWKQPECPSVEVGLNK